MKKFLTHPIWEKDAAETFVEMMITLNSKEFLTIINSKEFIDGKSGLPLLQKVQERLDKTLTNNQISASYYTVEGNGLFVHFDNTFLKMKVFEVNSLAPDSDTLAVKFWGQNVNDPFDNKMLLDSYLKQNFVPVLIDWDESEDHPLTKIVKDIQNFDFKKVLDESKIPFGDKDRLISLLENSLETFKSDDWEVLITLGKNLQDEEDMWCYLTLRPDILKQFDKQSFNAFAMNLIFEKNTVDSTLKLTHKQVGTIESALLQSMLKESK